MDVLDPAKFVKTNAAGPSTGFQQVILPKSNSIEQVILPNCIKIANINYYPNLTRFEFNDGTKLENLTIDGRNPNYIIEYILTNFVGSYTSNVEITNIPENFWLTEATCIKLTQIENVKLSGIINIGDGVNLTAIDWSTKRMLVEKFGNITTGSVIFQYKSISFQGNSISVNTTGTIESSGPAPVSLTIDGNEVPIDSDNKHVKIYYTIKDTSTGKVPSTDDIRFVDKWTPQLIIKEGLKGVYEITTQVFYTNSASKSVVTTLTVGFYAPKVGDFAYANGSFSSVCDLTQGLVGVVFYSNKSVKDGKNVYDVRVLSADYSSTDLPLGPAKYAYDYYYSETVKNRQYKYNSLLTELGLEADTFVSDVVPSREGGNPNGTIKYDSKIENVPLEDVKL